MFDIEILSDRYEELDDLFSSDEWEDEEWEDDFPMGLEYPDDFYDEFIHGDVL